VRPLVHDSPFARLVLLRRDVTNGGGVAGLCPRPRWVGYLGTI